MTDNLAIWTALEKTDPKHVKPITGKSYSGNSPKPHYIIWRLTEQFGPVGYGFGWNVIHEAYIDGIPHSDGVEKLHECRIEFWWAEEANIKRHVESYGATKALYKAGTKGGQPGYWISDEDAAKKSLTDAIVKAASWLGAAGDIFMGRWDDSKYVAELKQEFAAPRQDNPALKTGPYKEHIASKDVAHTLAGGDGDAETPHDPMTGEIYDERNPPPPVEVEDDPFSDDIERMGKPGYLRNFMSNVRDKCPPRADRRALSIEYLKAFADDVGERKSSKKARPWLELFAKNHQPAIEKLDDDLKATALEILADARERMGGDFTIIGTSKREPDPDAFIKAG